MLDCAITRMYKGGLDTDHGPWSMEHGSCVRHNEAAALPRTKVLFPISELL